MNDHHKHEHLFTKNKQPGPIGKFLSSRKIYRRGIRHRNNLVYKSSVLYLNRNHSDAHLPDKMFRNLCHNNLPNNKARREEKIKVVEKKENVFFFVTDKSTVKFV